MSNIKLFADSTCDLPLSEIKKMDIDIIPLIVTFGDDAYKEGTEINTKDLFRLVKEKNMLPKTSAPSPADFYNAFKPYVDAGKTIIYLGLSSKVSTTLQNAKLAAENLNTDSIIIIDSLSLCVGTGALIRQAYNYISSGMPLDEIIYNIQKNIANYKLYFTVETLDYLHMGGRCSSTEALFGKMLNIKPIISMCVDGLDVWKKTRGKKKAINLMIEEIILDKDNILNDEIHVGCTVGNEEERSLLKKQITELTGITKFQDYIIGCVISSHCGEGTLGLGYLLNEELIKNG
ncbi:DegV family protein with EDD domain [Sedimentibacter acidaminivorans]|uniref:DegV family protein with EDD domain n=1 Tax=Sedimentibacter acidaminivorans TaxID=913099 RepID=A0ABS4GEX5_9FIRM|nr:DegV family protein [Sedimentibacter acidaminivorans]MBP1926192.1 DegV family protein with EDD domain [Sedimentibacter acidaminivorans]